MVSSLFLVSAFGCDVHDVGTPWARAGGRDLVRQAAGTSPGRSLRQLPLGHLVQAAWLCGDFSRDRAGLEALDGQPHA